MDPQIQERLMIYGGFAPGAIALVLLMTAWYIHAFKKSRIDHAEGDEPIKSTDGPRWMLPIVLALGFAGADYALSYSFHFWPTSNNDRFTHAITLIALAGMIEGVVSLPMLVGFLVRVVAFGGAFWMLGEGYRETVFGGTEIFVGSAVFAALAAAMIATASDQSSEETPAWVESITWLVIAGASMWIFLQNQFAIGAMIPAGIIAVLVAALIVGLIFREFRFSRGGVSVLVGYLLAMLTGSIIQSGAVYLPAVLLLALSPMVTLVTLKDSSRLRLLLTRLALLVVILGSAIGTLVWSVGGSPGDGAGDSYLDSDYSPMEQ
jgi:hypothetical protein